MHAGWELLRCHWDVTDTAKPPDARGIKKHPEVTAAESSSDAARTGEIL